jgi:putative zinc finger/helix-turn-helix YgiT family protein
MKEKETKCPVCNVGVLKEVSGDFITEYTSRDGEVVPLKVRNLTWLQCNQCGESILDDIATSAVEAAQRHAEGLLSAAEIKGLRIGLRLTQAELSRLLGIGEKTYCRWERGAYVQSLAFDRYLRLLIAEPSNVDRLREMESTTQSRIEASELPRIYHTEEFAFENLQLRESLVERGEVFTELLMSGQLHNPGILSEVQ